MSAAGNQQMGPAPSPASEGVALKKPSALGGKALSRMILSADCCEAQAWLYPSLAYRFVPDFCYVSEAVSPAPRWDGDSSAYGKMGPL